MLTPVDEVRATILAACAPLPAVDLPLADARGCVAAAAVVAAADVPPFANTAMDGYAVRAADTAAAPVRLDVIGLLPAGAAPDPSRPLGPGQAIRIMTGAPMPPGADAVVMVERTTALGDDINGAGPGVLVHTKVAIDENVRFPGSDLRAGREVVAPGVELTPALLGVVASVGQATVSVHRPPVVGVLSTGDELVAAGAAAPLRPGQIYDSNRPMLLAMAAETGAIPLDLGHALDDPDAIAAALEGALARCDVVLLTGGVSVGDFDFVGDVFARFGETRAWEVAVKPGKPLAWGFLKGRPVFGLPGNPVSAAVSYELFARPAIRTLAGHRATLRPVQRALAGEPFRRRRDGKLHVVRAVAVENEFGRIRVHSAGGQGSHMLGALAAGNALVLLPDGEGVDEGAAVDVVRLGPG